MLILLEVRSNRGIVKHGRFQSEFNRGKVYNPDIASKSEKLYKKPGYTDIGPRRLLKYWSGSRVEAKGGRQGAREAHPLQRAVTTERRRQLPFCLAPSTVAWIWRWPALLAWPRSLRISTLRFAPCKPKSTSNATHPKYFNSLLADFISRLVTPLLSRIPKISRPLD